MGPVNLTTDDFYRLVQQGGRLLVHFGADWCPSSKAFTPVFERASQRHPDVVFAKVDTEAETEIGTVLEIESIPTVMGFFEGDLRYRQVGYHEPDTLDQVVAAMRRLH